MAHALYFLYHTHHLFACLCPPPPNYSTTAHGKKHWRKRFKRKVSAAAKKVRMKRKSRKGGETNHLIKEETDVTSPAVCVPHPECKLDEIVLDGSFKASDIVRCVSQFVYILSTNRGVMVREQHD